uniref:FYN-binding protein n=1 Tax=Parasteatoda tepidariorum TaxID=114398 RepID=A0A2L2Y908_PARTP
MADDSPGKVQALRAMFSEKNNPLMGMMPPGGKLSNRPWKGVVDTTENISSLKEKIIREQKTPQFNNANKVLPFPISKNSATKGDVNKETNGADLKIPNKVLPKPYIGPKPTNMSQQIRTNSTLSAVSESQELIMSNGNKTISDSQALLNSQAKSKVVAETIASFMFSNGFSLKENESMSTNANNKNNQPPIPKPRSSLSRTNLQDQLNVINSQSNRVSKSSSDTLSDMISSDNYICKSNCNFRRKELPSLESLGPAPAKPPKPSHMVLPAKYCSSNSSESLASVRSSQPPPHPPPALPHNFTPPVPQRPGYPCPPRPHTPPPLPPSQIPTAPVIKPKLSLREEIEELYEDTLLEHCRRPVSLIPEYTEEEEAEELYNDADDVTTFSPPSTLLIKPKNPPPPCPSEYLQPNVHSSTEELYQDAEDANSEEFYEVMPCDTIFPEESGSPVYSNNKKEIERLQREEEKKVRKEQKEKEKREKEQEKLRRKFGLTGEEIPIDDGLVKTDSRGGKGDLPVKKGETVLILRMEGNPSGKWLVKNEKGKIGYVELANIEVDPLSVKSVMITRRQSVISINEELYCEARSEEEEGIYEVTY